MSQSGTWLFCLVGTRRRSLLLQSVWLLTRNRLPARPPRGPSDDDRTATAGSDQGLPHEVPRRIAGHGNCLLVLRAAAPQARPLLPAGGPGHGPLSGSGLPPSLPAMPKTFSPCPCFLRPYSQFALPVHGAAARLLVQGRSPDRVSELLCQGPEAGGISRRTILRWQRRWKDGASSLLSTLSERVLALSPGTDLTPYLSPPRMPRGSLQALFSLGGLCRGMVWGSRRPPLFLFLRLSLPSGVI